MTLPSLPAAAGRRRERRLAGAVVLVVLALAALGQPGRADDADPFTATVKVDATAASVVKAREAARAAGQRRALAAVVAQLSAGGAAAAKVAKLDDNAITDLVASFEVTDEHMSAVRYLADYTFHFRPDAVKRLLGVAATGDQAGKPLIVLPLLRTGTQIRLWEDPNPWRDAWDSQPAGAGAAAPIVVPLGDVGDIAAIDADKAGAGDAAALAGVARRNGGDDAVVALATMRGPPDAPTGVDVMLRRYRAGQLVDSRPVPPLSANPGETEADLLRRAASVSRAAIQSDWQRAPLAGYDQQGSLTAVLPITGLEDWVAARQRLAAVPTVHKLALVALSRQEATIELDYVGTIDQLKASLAGIHLDLVQGDKQWRLAHTAAGATP